MCHFNDASLSFQDDACFKAKNFTIESLTYNVIAEGLQSNFDINSRNNVTDGSLDSFEDFNIWTEDIEGMSQFWRRAFGIKHSKDMPETILSDLTDKCTEKIVIFGWFPNNLELIMEITESRCDIPHRLVLHPAQVCGYSKINSLADLMGLNDSSAKELRENLDRFHEDLVNNIEADQNLLLQHLLDIAVMGVINIGAKRSFLASRVLGIKSGLGKSTEFQAFAVKNDCIKGLIRSINKLKPIPM